MDRTVTGRYFPGKGVAHRERSKSSRNEVPIEASCAKQLNSHGVKYNITTICLGRLCPVPLRT